MTFLFQIVESGGDAVISANWLMLILATIVGFFFIRTLNKIEKSQEALTKTVIEISNTQGRHEERISSMEDKSDKSNDELATEIVAKLRAITPR